MNFRVLVSLKITCTLVCCKILLNSLLRLEHNEQNLQLVTLKRVHFFPNTEFLSQWKISF